MWLDDLLSRLGRFLHREKKETGEDLYCGHTCAAWFGILVFLAIYNIGVISIGIGYYNVFSATLLSPSGSVPYRRANLDSNADLKNPLLSKLAEKVEQQLPYNGRVFPSVLDTPVMSHVPSRYVVKKEDEDEEINDLARRDNYVQQMRRVYRKTASGGTQNCDDDVQHFAEPPDNLLRTSCKFDVGTLLHGSGGSGGSDGSDGSSGSDGSGGSEGGSCLEEHGFGMHMLKSHNQPCVILKLNKVVGFIPDPYALKDIGNNHKRPGQYYQQNETLLNKRLYLTCSADTLDDDKDVLAVDPTFLTYFPGPYFDLKYFPYTGTDQNYAQPLVMVRLNMQQARYLDRRIQITCKAWAHNVPHKAFFQDPTTMAGTTSFTVSMHRKNIEAEGHVYFVLEK